jgi:hypothetical protein
MPTQYDLLTTLKTGLPVFSFPETVSEAETTELTREEKYAEDIKTFSNTQVLETLLSTTRKLQTTKFGTDDYETFTKMSSILKTEMITRLGV